MAYDQILERESDKEFKSLIAFCKTMVVKKQEVADFEETKALIRSVS